TDGEALRATFTSGISGRPSSSVEATDGRLTRNVSTSGARYATTQRVQSDYETKPSGFSRVVKGGPEDPLRSFKFLSIRK
nr:casein kinase I-like [Tanacetum cinerariifolium]